MGKKKIIITRNQLKKLNETEMYAAAPQNTAGSYEQTINNAETQNQMRTFAQTTGKGRDTNLMVSGPNSKETSGIVNIEVPKGKTPADVINQDPSISKAIEGGSKAIVTGVGFPFHEGTRYTKKQLEEARLMSMLLKGHLTTKAKLFEDTDNEGPLSDEENYE